MVAVRSWRQVTKIARALGFAAALAIATGRAPPRRRKRARRGPESGGIRLRGGNAERRGGGRASPLA